MIFGGILLLLAACNQTKEEPKVEEVVISASEVAGYYADSLIYTNSDKYQEYSGTDMSSQDKEAYDSAIQYFIESYSMGEYELTYEEAAIVADAFNDAIVKNVKYEIMGEKVENNEAVVTIRCWPANTKGYQETMQQDFNNYLISTDEVISDRERSLWLVNYRVDYYKNKTAQISEPVLYEMIFTKENDKWVPAEEIVMELSTIMQV